MDAREWERGLNLAARLCDLAPDDPRGWVGRALCLARLGRVGEAQVSARRAVLLAPGDAEVRRLAAELARLPAGETVSAFPVGGLVPSTLLDSLEPTPAPPAAAAPVGPLSWPLGTVVEGRWEVRGSARGGMGEVVFVFDREIGRMAAVKWPHPEQLASAEGRARFLREAEAWIGLGLHPNVCAAYFVHAIDGVPRLFIEYVDGGSLDDWERENRSASLAVRLDLALQLAAGMQHAHTFSWQDEAGVEHRGIVHRDLKPGNVLVSRAGEVRVTDFGLVGRPGLSTLTLAPRAGVPAASTAHLSASGTWGTLTVGDVLMGTPPYMPPEQWDGAHLVGAQGDIYAFGCILYELVAGRRPFQLEGGVAMVSPEVRVAEWERMHRTVPPPGLGELVSGVDPELAALARRCLEKDPAGRPQDFASVREVLAQVYCRVAGRPYERGEPEATTLLADTLNNQGVSWVTLDQPRRAEAAWRRALAVHPQHIEASYNLALLHWRGGRTDAETRAVLAEVRRAHSATWRDEHLAGRMDLCLGRPEAALACLRVAADSAPDWEAARDAALAAAAVAWRDGDARLWSEVVGRLDAHGERVTSDPWAAAVRQVALGRLGEVAAVRRGWEAAAAAGQELGVSAAALAAQVIPGASLVGQVTGVSGRTTAAAVTADGRTAVLVGEDGRVSSVNPATGEVLRSPRPAGARPRALAVHPGGDLVLLACAEERVGVWSLARGALDRQLQIHPGILGALAVTFDGRWALGLGSEGSLTVWDLAGGQRVASWRAHAAYGTCLAAVAADRAASAGADGAVRVWEIPSGRQVTELKGDQVVTALAFGVRGEGALVAREDGGVEWWDVCAGRLVTVLRGHADYVTFVAWAGVPGHALSASQDGTLRFWDLDRREVRAVVQAGGAVNTGASSATSDVVLLAHGAGAALLNCSQVPTYRPGWALAQPLTADLTRERLTTFRFTLAQAEAQLDAHDWQQAIERLRVARAVDGFARAPQALAVLARLQEHLPHRALRDAWEERRIEAHRERVTAVAASSDGRLAASAGADGRVALWRLADGEPVWSLFEPAGLESALAFTPEGRRLVSGGVAHTLRLWDISVGRVIGVWAGHGGQITQLAVGWGGRFGVSVSVDHTAKVWELESGICMVTFSQHRAPILAVALDPGERFAVTGDDTGVVLVWEIERGGLVGRLEGKPAAVTALAVTPDGRQVIAGDRDGAVRLFDLRSGRCLRVLDSGGDAVTCLAVAPDGKFAVSGGRSGALRVWELRGSAKCVELGGHTGAVSGVAFAPRGQRLLSAAADGTLRVWFCEWEPEFGSEGGWDERAIAYLELFIQRHGIGPWREEALRSLLDELAERGFGRLRPDGVRHRLEDLAHTWRGLPMPVLRGEGAATTSRSPLVGAGLGALRQWRGVLAVAAGVLALVGGIGAWRTATKPRFSQLAVERVQTQVKAELLATRQVPADGCERSRLPEYLHAFAHPYEVAAETAAAATTCLEDLADPASVEPLLALVRMDGPGEDESVWEALQSYRSPRVAATLARMGEPVVGELAGALDDAESGVSGTAARALALGGSERAIAALGAAVYDPETGPRQAVAAVLPELIATGRLSPEKALILVERLAGDRSALTRRLAVGGLALLRGRAARRLAERLATDPDPDVRAAALALK